MAEIVLHSPAHILSRLLIQKGLASDPAGSSAWPVFVGKEPDTPDNCLTIRNTTGRDFGFTQVDGARQEHHGVQVRVRSTTNDVGFVKARAIALSLDSSILDEQVTIQGTTYKVQSVTRAGDVISLGKDRDSARHLHTLNATAIITQ